MGVLGVLGEPLDVMAEAGALPLGGVGSIIAVPDERSGQLLGRIREFFSL